jgi:hypothetical protein
MRNNDLNMKCCDSTTSKETATSNTSFNYYLKEKLKNQKHSSKDDDQSFANHHNADSSSTTITTAPATDQNESDSTLADVPSLTEQYFDNEAQETPLVCYHSPGESRKFINGNKEGHPQYLSDGEVPPQGVIGGERSPGTLTTRDGIDVIDMSHHRKVKCSGTRITRVRDQ